MALRACGKCNRVRYFSGNPLQCEKCGQTYIYTPLAPRTLKEWVEDAGLVLKRASITVLKISAGLLTLWGVATAYDYYFNPADYYAQKYNTKQSNVIINREPHDCDFDTAPLGNKNCHYDKDVNAEKDATTGVVTVYVTWDKVSE